MAVDKDEFKCGFWMALAQNGITPADLGHYLLEKHALEGLIPIEPSSWLRGLGTLAEAPFVLGGVASAGLGALGGGAAYLGTRPTYGDQVSDYKDKEAVRQLRLRINQIRTRMAEPNRHPLDVQIPQVTGV